MRSKLVAVAAVMVCVAGAAGVHAQKDQKGSQKQFQVFAKFVDSTGGPAKAVTPENLRVSEDDADAKVVNVEPIDWPVKLQLLIDNGIGLGNENLSQLRNGLKQTIEAFPDGMEVTMITTAPQPRTLVKPTTDKQAMLKGIDLLSYDSGAGRFIESLNEALGRIEKDKTNAFPVVLSIGSTSGDNNVLDRDVQQIMKRLQAKPTVVHVIMFVGGRSASAGGNQIDVGINVTKLTQGRYESINSGSRLVSLLPEFGKLAAQSHGGGAGQFRITVERPANKSGDLGAIKMGATGGVSAVSLQLAR